ncbi:hypothetical protein A5N82_13885 [Christensenella minuta]|uniref:Single-stranded DNA-binding protein n=1 Tax=Christensenella minuta TaxID=626937 RepID=A0A136Q8P1_9FIRM|nr:single-stranded DNA-binding protein [Christensenella minuta]AYH40738.1 single-stranded DNA-binding protein [Christensenella minuta]AYH41600.1 single-stranded DNA-binding protein [Christensenella minuta]KXK66946.1 single-strand binding family protein [Christensenella minuta]OAQ37900.1 hypothetical protein A5N82_13885 [Christensenella minuta]
MNLVVLKGRLAMDPEVRTTGSGKTVSHFTVACDAGKDRPADFISCTAWDKTAELIGKWFSKGKEILLTGSVKVSKYETETGTRYKTYVLTSRIEFCGSREAKANETPGGLEGLEEYAPLDDSELPF